jgi:RNA polymerase sigma-70 factor (ECF subfamily)
LAISTIQIWEELNIPLRKFIAKRVHESDVEDILQNVFCKIHDNIDQVRNENKIRAWVYQIGHNAIVDYYRNRKLTVDFSMETSAIAAPNPADSHITNEVAECLEAMISSLPGKYQEVLLLIEFENLTQKELSERLGLTISGAKSRVQRARKKLQEVLLNCCHIEFDHYGNIADYRHKKSTCKYC